jgi:hypothetical protein
MPGTYWQDTSRRPDVIWPGRGLAHELGTRAYRYLQREGHRDDYGGVFPPALEEAE